MSKLMTVLEVEHWGADGALRHRQSLVPNIWHRQGEAFCVGALFNTSATPIPVNYYCGLDNRVTPAATDTLDSLSQEPSQFGYVRQAVSSSSGFTVTVNASGVYQATTNVLTFVVSGGTWGPVRNIFLTDSATSSGVLISTAALDGPRSVGDGEKLTLRLGLTLRDASLATFPS